MLMVELCGELVMWVMMIVFMLVDFMELLFDVICFGYDVMSVVVGVCLVVIF